jgi:hypothetical protein
MLDGYVSQSDINAFTNTSTTRADFFRAGQGSLATKFFTRRPFMVQIGNCIFSHADIAASLPVNDLIPRVFQELNNDYWRVLRRGKSSITTDRAEALGLNQLFAGDDRYLRTPMWNRNICLNLTAPHVSNDLHFISAHTPKNKITFTANKSNRFWCIDTGRSRAFNSQGETALQVSKATALKITNLDASSPNFEIVGPSSRST